MSKLSSFLGGVTAGGIAGYAYGSTRKGAAAPKKKKDDALEQLSGPGSDYTPPESDEEPEQLAGPDKADGGEVKPKEDKSRRRKQIDDAVDDATKAEAFRDGGKVGAKKKPVIPGYYADGGILGEAFGTSGMAYGTSPSGSYEMSRYKENHSANPCTGFPDTDCTKRDFGK